MLRLRSPFLALACAAVIPFVAQADPQLASPFQDHAVFQHDKPITIWGKADPGEHLSVNFSGQTLMATAAADGRWSVLLDPLGSNSSGADLNVAGKTVVTIHDILVGEVWLCAGQANMEFTVEKHGDQYGVENAASEIAAARYPSVRQFKIARQASATPATDVAGNWKTCTPENVGEFSAVGYYFARDLSERLNVPIGIINCTWASTPLEAWMSPESLAAFPTFSNGHPVAGAAAGVPDPWVPASVFNGMLHPLLAFPIAGVIWYQGESNVGHAAEYAAHFPALITSWRALYGVGDFPFLWVQLANYSPPEAPGGEAWALLREAQSRALSLPMTGQVVAIDIGEAANIHPRNKQEVGRRLALIAKAQVYSVAVDSSGPVLDKAVVEGSSMRIHFLFAGEGLTASGKPLQSFELAGADKVFHPAAASIVGDSVIVRSLAVQKPVAVRYAWHNAPYANLFNGAGLPAAPFRSDAW
jgi:sialate O-acetylesterase